MNLEALMISTILFLTVSIICVTVSERLRLGSILGFLVAGVVLGPHSPGPVMTTRTEELLGIGELGVVLLMFAIGLEMQPSKLWSMRRLLFGLGPVQFFLTAAAIAGGLMVTSQLATNAVILVGLGLALSSTAIGMQVLGEKGEIASDHGKATFAVLVFQDMACVAILILVPFLLAVALPVPDVPWWEEGLFAIGALVGVVVFGRFVLPFMFSWTARHQPLVVFGLVVLIAVMAAALAMEEGGMSMAMGAFLLGMMLSASDFRSQVEATVVPLKRIFMGLFFVAVGMSINFDIVLETGPRLFFFLFQIVGTKTVIMLLLGMAFGLGRVSTLRTTALLSPCSEFGFVVLAAAKAGGILGAREFAIGVVLISLSMALTPFMVNLGYWLARRIAGKPKGEHSVKAVSQELQNHVVVAGCGRTGRLMCTMLEKTDTPYIAFDINLKRVAAAKGQGHNAHFGDVADPSMHGAAAFAKARSVVVTMEDMTSAGRLVDQLRNFYPHLPIQLAAPDLPTRDAMREKGVADAVCNVVEGNLQLGEVMLRAAGVDEVDVQALAEALRDDDYALIRQKTKSTQPA